MSKLFCYGTLKRNFRAHDILQKCNAVYLGKAKTESRYQLYKVNWFPGMVFDEHQQEGGVHGELYEITKETFVDLDRYEGAPDLFRREKIRLDTGEEAIAYIFNRDADDLERVEDGEWREGRLDE
jgi:gamma-glutamylcyclotransferase (GGCT)/AIG2-like uncharacterized protein YtfP